MSKDFPLILPRSLALLFLLVFAAVPSFGQSTFGQSSDVAITIQATGEQGQPIERIAVGREVHYVIRWTGETDASDLSFEIDVPGPIKSIRQGFITSCTTGNPVRCNFDSFNNLSSVVIDVPVDRPGVLTATVRVVRPNGGVDSNPANDTATSSVLAVAAPSLVLSLNIDTAPLGSGEPRKFSFYVLNEGATPATNVNVAVALPEGGSIVSGEAVSGAASCSIANNALRCHTASLEKSVFLRFEVGFIAPDRLSGEDMVIDMDVTSAEEDFDPTDNHRTFNAVMMRQLIVSNVNDEGGGSLRQAIHDVRSLCAVTKPCAILFRIPAPVPENGWFTIQPRTRLPEIPGTLTIDGRTQTLFTGDTNPDGPEIEIDGSFVNEGSGLLLHPYCQMTVRNLAVNGFPGYGMEVRQRGIGHDEDACIVGSSLYHPTTIRENYLGTDPRGRIAKPNHRGLGIFTAESYAFQNLISGNRRSGIYIGDGAYHLIGGNKIGVAADGSPLGNGSGIFVDMGTPGTEGGFIFVGADIISNVIAHNHGMAIARTRRGEILISRNSIFDNLQSGIDVGIDGVTPQRADDRDVPNAPVLFGATYDAPNHATIVRGRIDSEAHADGGPTGESGRTIEIYASLRLSGWAEPQAEQSVAISPIPSGHQDFEIVVPGDLRGMWITATHNTTHFLGLLRRNPGEPSTESHRELFPGDTSELSNAVPVH